MKKIFVLFGCSLAIGLLLITSGISAAEVHTIKDTQKTMSQKIMKETSSLPRIRLIDVLKEILESFLDWWGYVQQDGGLLFYLLHTLIWILQGSPMKY